MLSKDKFLEGKRVLLTSYSYALFGGAELNPVELADELVSFGAKVSFFSYDIDGPLTEYINKKFNTKVITDTAYCLAEDVDDLNNIELNINDYDYIWVGANVVPISIIKQVNTATVLPKFIFIHMSALPAFPLDAPLLPEFEVKIASKILTISERTSVNCISRIIGQNSLLGDWKNPVPRDFKLLKSRNGELKKIAVISSSHPTEEIINIKQLIKEYNIDIDYIGRFNNNAQVIDAEFYDKYDLIIGIGKNARYSLVSGVPIYIYGRFGGSGYINDNNYATNNDNNFSGRGFGKKNSNEIVKEIIEGYDKSLIYHNKKRKYFIEEYSIDIAAEKLFRELELVKTKDVSFTKEYINWLVSMQINIMQRLQIAAEVRNMQTHINNEQNHINDMQTHINNLESRLEQFNNKLKIYLKIKKVIHKLRKNKKIID